MDRGNQRVPCRRSGGVWGALSEESVERRRPTDVRNGRSVSDVSCACSTRRLRIGSRSTVGQRVRFRLVHVVGNRVVFRQPLRAYTGRVEVVGADYADRWVAAVGRVVDARGRSVQRAARLTNDAAKPATPVGRGGGLSYTH